MSDPSEDRVGGHDLRPLAYEDGQPLQKLFTADPGYFEAFHGHPPGAEAQSTFSALPDGKSYDDKELWGAYDGPALVGVVDAISHYPNSGTWTVGIVFVQPARRREGVGRALVRHIASLPIERNGD